MALQCCLKMSLLHHLEKQLWRAAHLSSFPQKTVLYSPHYLVSSSPTIPQRRYYRRFSRRPLEVRAAPQDRGKMLLGDYMDKTPTVDEDVLEEAKMIARLTKSTGENRTRTKSQFDESHQDANLGREKQNLTTPNVEHSKDYEAPSQGNSHNTNEIANEKTSKGRRPPFAHSDPVLNKALTAIRSEPFSKAFGKYRTLLSLCATTQLRDENDLVLLEGPKLIREAFMSNLEPVAMYQSRQKLLIDMMPQHMSLQEKVQRIHTFKTFKTPYKKLSTWSSVVKGQGLLGVFKLSEAASAPRLRRIEGHSSEVAPVTPVTVVLDKVREPGNLGAIIRTVASVGAQHIVLIKGCCDPWEGKALRAACGAHFGLRITRNVTWDSVYGYVPAYPNVYVADVCNSDRQAMKVPEGDQGYEQEEYDEDDETQEETEHADVERGQQHEIRGREERIKPPHSEKRERFFSKDQLNGKEKEMNSEDDSVEKTGINVSMDEEGKEILIDNSFNDEEHVKEYSDASLPTKYYNEHIYFPPNLKRTETPSVVLVIGSETGLSNCAKKFAVDNFGHQVSVPLHGGMDSLNTSVASGIILYELWNQAQKQQAAVVREVKDVAQ